MTSNFNPTHSDGPVIWAVQNGSRIPMMPTDTDAAPIWRDVNGVRTQFTLVDLTTDVQIVLPGKLPETIFDLIGIRGRTYVSFAKDTDAHNPTFIITRKRMDSEWEHLVLRLMNYVSVESPEFFVSLYAGYLARARVIGTNDKHKGKVERYWVEKKQKYDIPGLVDLDIKPMNFERNDTWELHVADKIQIVRNTEKQSFDVSLLESGLEEIRDAINVGRGDEVYAKMMTGYQEDEEEEGQEEEEEEWGYDEHLP